MKHYKNLIVKSILVLVLLGITYKIYINILPSIGKTFEVFGERFSSSNILDPLIIWVNSTIFIYLFSLTLVLVLPERQFGLIAKIRSISVTLGTFYIIYIGPILLLLLLLLFNVSVIYITLVLSTLSFIGITFKKGGELYSRLYNTIKRIL